MKRAHGFNTDKHFSKTKRFAGLMQAYLDRSGLTHRGAARVLCISPRNLRYLASGTTIPSGSTLALVESEIARGLGCPLSEIRDAVAFDRASRASQSKGTESYSRSQTRIARSLILKPEVSPRSHT